MRDAMIRFDDGATYEQSVGIWSRLVGADFLDWLEPAPGARWLDVGCGTGVFTELLVERCAPVEVHGVDPAEPQLAYARTRPAGRIALFRKGDAMALPYGRDRFDAAVMALVIFFVPDPPTCVAEMARVVRPGGTVAAYAWDIAGGGSAVEPVMAELRRSASHRSGRRTIRRPGSKPWSSCGRAADSKRRRPGNSRRSGPSPTSPPIGRSPQPRTPLPPSSRRMPDSEVDLLKLRVRSRLPTDAAGRIVQTARANAIKGRRPQ